MARNQTFVGELIKINRYKFDSNEINGDFVMISFKISTVIEKSVLKVPEKHTILLGNFVHYLSRPKNVKRQSFDTI